MAKKKSAAKKTPSTKRGPTKKTTVKKAVVKKGVVKKGPTRKKAAAANAAPGEKKMTKSQAIRDYFAEHKGAKPKDVVADLAKAGIKVSPQQVSSVRYSTTKKKTSAAKRPGRKPTANTDGSVRIESLLEASRFAEKVGGVTEAKKLLGAIERLNG